MKICVYAIAHNEAKHVKRFCDSAADADLILIADTGSEDDTVLIAKECGAKVYSISIMPWRFDTSRNAALALVPADVDVCISLDLDEVLEEGWREEIKRLWEVGKTTRLRYLFDWGHGKIFTHEKIHSKKGYYWAHPVHEIPVLDKRIEEISAYTDKLLVRHLPDETKSRGQYLNLLKLSVEEDPTCPRNAWYYARELYYYRMWPEAIDRINIYLNMPTAVWKAERSAALRVLSECHLALGNDQEAESCLYKAAMEDPTARESWIALSDLFGKKHQWEESFAYAMKALKITNKTLVYTSDPNAWGYRPHDLAAIAAYRLGLCDIAIKHGKTALELAPDDERLRDNMNWYLGNK
jgi:glycosyltransferase involved in cell wall biosynthesis